MKRTLLFTLIMISFSSLFAGPVKNVALNSNGVWARANNWSLGRVPQSKDSVVVPQNIVLTMEDNISLNDIILVVKGTLVLDKGKISLDEDSRIILEPGGKIIADNADEQIRIDNILKYSGKQGVLSGPAIADASTGKGFVVYSILPVRFLAFDAQKKQDKVLITWATDQEKNNSHFNVERSVDGATWSSIGVVFPNETSTINKYSFTDAVSTSPVVYYRIRQVDVDGGSSFSKVQAVRNQDIKNLAKVFSPSQNNIRVAFAQPLKNGLQIRVFSSNGQLVSTKSVASSTNRTDLVVNSGKGIYVVQLVDDNGSVESSRVVL
jgi:hypothetical protein